jgi:hypothetical protein
MRKFLMVTLVALVFSAPGYAQDNATVQRLADQFAEAFNKNSAAGVGDMYTDEAILIPPEADTRMGAETSRHSGRSKPEKRKTSRSPSSMLSRLVPMQLVPC